jgi:hypothetical protein
MRAVVAWLTVCAHPSFFLVVRGVRVWVTVGCCLKKERRSTGGGLMGWWRQGPNQGVRVLDGSGRGTLASFSRVQRWSRGGGLA